MSADFDGPTTGSTYVNVLADVRDSDTASAVMFNGVSVTNIPINAVQFAGGVFGLWNGSAFTPQAVAVAGGGTGATTAAEARSNLGVLSGSDINDTYMAKASNGSGIANKGTFRTNLDVYGKSEVYAKTETYSQAEVDTATAIPTQAQAEAGTNNSLKMTPLRTAQAIKEIGRTPTIIWQPAGAGQLSVTDAHILANSGFTVKEGTYFLVGASTTYAITIASVAGQSSGSGGVDVEFGTGAPIFLFAYRASNAFSLQRMNTATETAGSNLINRIEFIPL